MLVIRGAQFEAFLQSSHRQYENYARQHLQACFPRLCTRLGDAVIKEAIRAGRLRAEKHGFTIYRSLCTYLTLMFWLGAGFEEDPLYPWVHRLLENPLTTNELTKASLVQQAALDFLEQAEGSNFEHIRAALERIQVTPLEQLLPPVRGDFDEYMLQRLAWMHPHKCRAAGETSARRLIAQGIAAAREHGLTSEQSVGLYVGMMFMLGASFDLDPLLPWVPKLLEKQCGNEPSAAAASLHHACIAYLRVVNGRRP